MALARLITRTPEYAQQLARSLNSAGYTVEFASPDETHSQPAELEVNLDDPSAASAYIMTADGREISFAYDPIEREFVLAPLWRKLTATAALLTERWRRQAPEPASETAPEVPVMRDVEAPVAAPEFAVMREAEAPVAAPDFAVMGEAEAPESQAPVDMVEIEETHLPVSAAEPEPIAQSLYLQSEPVIEPEFEPIRFSSSEYFDGVGERRQPGNQPAIEEPVAPKETVPPAPPRKPLEVQLAEQVAAFRSAWSERWQAWNESAKSRAQEGSRHVREYDRAWMRAVPAAAVITLAFLLGWSFANSGDAKPRAATATAAEAKEAAVVPVPVRKAPVVKAASNKAVPKPKAARVNRDDEEDEAEDVVVRHYPKHYPSKGVQAANQKAVRRYSDLED